MKRTNVTFYVNKCRVEMFHREAEPDIYLTKYVFGYRITAPNGVNILRVMNAGTNEGLGETLRKVAAYCHRLTSQYRY